MSYRERHLYDAGGHTSYIYYIRIINRGSGQVWNPITEVMVNASDITWVDSADILVEEEDAGGFTGVFPIDIPLDERTIEDLAIERHNKRYVDLTDVQKADVATAYNAIRNLPGGTYDIIVYKQLGSEEPANSDDVEKQYEFKHGSIFGF